MSRIARVVLALAVVIGGTVGIGAVPAAAHTPHDHIVDIAVSPEFAEDGTAYTISREYVLRTTDGGDTWTRLHRGLDNKVQPSGIEIDRDDPDRVYVSTRGDGVFRSDDGGDSWERAAPIGPEAMNVRFLWVSPHDGDRLYASNPMAGVWTSGDGGDSWTSVERFESQLVLAMAFHPARPELVYAGGDGALVRSDDGGASWVDVGEETIGDASVRALLVPSDAELGDLVIGTDRSLLTLGAGELEAASGIGDPNITSVAEAEGGRLIAVSWTEGPYVSDDGGRRWTRRDDGLTTTGMAADLGYPDFSVAAADPGRSMVLLAGYDGLFRSDDGGRGSWEELTTQDAMNLTALTISPNYAEDGSVLVTTYVNGPKLSTDRGRTWQSLVAGIAFKNDYLRHPAYYTRLTGSLFAPDYATSGRLYTAARGYLFSTDDPSSPWQPTVVDALVEEGEFPPDYLIPAYSPNYEEDATWLAGTDSGRILRKQGDDPFEIVGDIPDTEIVSFVLSPEFGTDGTYFAATIDGLHRGTTNGDDPELIAGSPPGITSVAVSPGYAEDRTIFVGTRRGLFVTGDAGATWQAVPWATGQGRPVIESVVLSPTFATDRFVLVSERGNGLFRSTDGGVTWEPTGQDLLDRNVVLTSFYHPTGEPIAFSPDFAEDRTIFGTAASTLYRSTDAGETWTAIDLPRETHPTTEASAPNELLLYPKAGDAEGHEGEHGGSSADAAAASTPGTRLVLTKKRAAVALVLAALAVAALALLRVERKLPRAVLVWSFRVAAGLLVLLTALWVLGRRT